ncbi:MAG TPA: MltA domain-containing protein [Rickettsiales bacterium]|nr:MltA domain-containing protein [Rickettsiales bacterium]
MLKILLILLLFINVSNAETISSNSNTFYLKQVEFADLRNWGSDDLLGSLQAFLKSCTQMGKMNQNQILSTELNNIEVKDLRNVCDIARVIVGATNEDAKLFFESWFTPFLVVDRYNGKTGLFTGYYEASIRASRFPGNEYIYPIYKRPNDLTSAPYYTREEIENGALKNKNLEIFYTDSKVSLAFLQIQGSGILELNDGTTTKIAFDGKNNRTYRSIGSILIEKKYMKRKDVNATSIKEWFKNNPDKIDEVLNENESYIFFKEQYNDYIIGAHGSILTPFRSIAIDNKVLPYGFPFWIETKIEENNHTTKFDKLTVSQDTGSAIRGVVRADIFFGSGDTAEELASKMKFKGQYYILIPNTIIKKIKY